MPSDALHYSFLAKELNARLLDGKIEKITMPEKDEIVLGIRARGKNFSLIISASPASARCHLTDKKKENPLVAPSFLMHLRKHIGSAKILSVSCEKYERVLKISLLTRTELDYEERKTLIAEIMGKYSNIILVDGNGVITDCIRHVGIDVSSKRQILPSLEYLPPPSQNKITPLDFDSVRQALSDFEGGDLPTYLIRRLKGLAPVSIQEAIYRALGQLDTERLSAENADHIIKQLSALYDDKDISPCLIVKDGAPTDFFIRPYGISAGSPVFFDTLSQAMDAYFFDRDKVNRFNEKSSHLQILLKNAIARTEKKLSEFIERREKCRNLDVDKLCGELIIGNIYRIKAGLKSVTLENWYDSDKPITITLEPDKTPQANAAKYFARYTKKKRTLEQIEPLILQAQEELEYFYSILPSFSTCKENAEIDDLAYELERAGILKKKGSKEKSKIRKQASTPISVFCDGFTVKIGKNNVQNESLTKSAKSDDIWLHTRGIHGSHVIICSEGKTVPDSVILTAARYAAQYSKAAHSQNVPVDYTLAKYVNKPVGAPLGKVVYTHQKTLFVNPIDA